MRAAPLPFCRCLAPTRTGALPSTKIDCKRSLTSQATPSLLHPCYVRSGGARGCCCQKCRFPGTPLHRACANLHLLHTRLSRSRTTPLKHLLLYPGQPLLSCAHAPPDCPGAPTVRGPQDTLHTESPHTPHLLTPQPPTACSCMPPTYCVALRARRFLSGALPPTRSGHPLITKSDFPQHRHLLQWVIKCVPPAATAR